MVCKCVVAVNFYGGEISLFSLYKIFYVPIIKIAEIELVAGITWVCIYKV